MKTVGCNATALIEATKVDYNAKALREATKDAYNHIGWSQDMVSHYETIDAVMKTFKGTPCSGEALGWKRLRLIEGFLDGQDKKAVSGDLGNYFGLTNWYVRSRMSGAAFRLRYVEGYRARARKTFKSAMTDYEKAQIKRAKAFMKSYKKTIELCKVALELEKEARGY